MAFCLQIDEAVSDGLKRIAEEQLRFAIRQLRAGKDLHKRVHEARKSLKKTRALLRLVRDELGPAYVEENRRVREAGRRISALRDAQATLETIDGFARKNHLIRKLAFVRQVLEENRQALEKQSDWNALMGECAQELAAVERRVEAWPLPHLTSANDLLSALRDSYRGARQALSVLRRDSTSDHFHELRKRTKTHLYQLQIVAGVMGGAWQKRIAELKELSDCIGEQHNFVVLAARLSGGPGELPARLDRDRVQLEGRALEMAQQLYAVRAKQFRWKETDSFDESDSLAETTKLWP